jgi:hypothetical protein
MSKTLREKYFEQFAANCLAAIELTKKKNEGYTAGSNDPYKNFRFAAELASLPGREQVTVVQTILSRMADKFSRLKSLYVHPEFSTQDESVMDTVKDLFVYTNIMLTYLQLGEPQADTTYPTPEEEPEVPSFDDMGTTLEPNYISSVAAGSKLAQLYNWTKEKIS